MNKRSSAERLDGGAEILSVMSGDTKLEEKFYLEDLENRKLVLNDDITSYSTEDVIMNILRINAADRDIEPQKRKPILLYLSTAGGSLESGFALIDAIVHSKTPVYTINFGCWYSMGFLIGLAGHQRFAMPNARFLMHDGSSMIYDSSAKARDRMAFNDRVEERIKAYTLEKTAITSEEYDRNLRVEWYMFSDEAMQYHVVDHVVGVDCDIDAIT